MTYEVFENSKILQNLGITFESRQYVGKFYRHKNVHPEMHAFMPVKMTFFNIGHRMTNLILRWRAFHFLKRAINFCIIIFHGFRKIVFTVDGFMINRLFCWFRLKLDDLSFDESKINGLSNLSYKTVHFWFMRTFIWRTAHFDLFRPLTIVPMVDIIRRRNHTNYACYWGPRYAMHR